MHSAIVLAAGFSQRMGEPKPFLKINNKTFIKTIIDNLKNAGIEEIILVANPLHKEILESIPLENITICYNLHSEFGQFSSLKIGIDYISTNTDDFFMCLVDCPLVRLETYIKLLCTKKEKHPYILIPTYKGRKGHPVLFSKDFLPIIASFPPTYNAKKIIESHSNSVILVDVDDEGILIDIDTKDEYNRIIK